MSIDAAIAILEAEVDSFNQGVPRVQPEENTTEWFILRAKALGLSHLRRMKQLGAHEDPAAAERFYRNCSSTFKKLNVPDPVPVAVSGDPLGVASA